jgi:chromosome partitioning protein
VFTNFVTLTRASRAPNPGRGEKAGDIKTAIHRFDKAFAFVLNQAPVRGQRPAHVATGLNGVGVLAFPYIALRNDHMDSLAAGLAVSEFAPDGIAPAEIRGLWAWSKQRLMMAALVEKPAPELARAATAIR